MNERAFEVLLILVAIGFTLFFAITVVPPVLESGDVIGAAGAGFVNPYAAGYSTDTILCWVVLAIWIVHEARTRSIRKGWICLVLGLVPGVAVGFALYLILRERQRPHAARS